MLMDVLKMYRTIWLTWCLALLRTVTCDETETNNCIFNSMCACSPDQINPNPSIDSIACYSVPFYKFPAMPVKQIDRIEVLDSMIPSLETDTLNSCELQALVFNNNKLQHISDKIFSSSLETLVSLDLSYNRLDGVPFHAIKDLKNLHWLNLHGNQISSINGEWSYMKSTLNTLFMGQNDLTEIADTSSHNSHNGLRQLKSLTWLNADANKIHKIHKHSLPSSLKTVSFSYNLIENFPLDIISAMPRLEWLYLRGNHIKTIPEHTFEKKFYIQKIDLDQNFLKTLPVRPFNSSIFVRDVFLGMNDFQTITTGSFSGLDCRRIVLSYNQIEYMEMEAFQRIEKTLEYLDLDHNKLKTFPAAITLLEAIRFLYLSFNHLLELPTDSLINFQDSLKALTMTGNRMSKIPAEALKNCSKMSYFNIASNVISSIYKEDFENWGSSVQILNINNNRIISLNSKVFEEMPKLRELSLSYNPLRYVDLEAFGGLNNLETLELSASFERDDLPYEAFKELQALKHLYLDHNNFHEIKPSSFDNLREIEYLSLDSNKIQFIPPSLFKPLIHSKLTTIVLSNNELSYLESGTFRNLESLEIAWLNENKLQEIKAEAFDGLPHLSTVFLKNNELFNIFQGAFNDLPALKHLDLQFNHLTHLDLGQLQNLSSPLALNCSYNQISSCTATKLVALETLDIRHNKLLNIPACLQFAPLLKRLILDNNGLIDLDFNSFSRLLALEQLSLHRNNINTVDLRAFAGLQNLQILDMSKNSISFLHNHQFIETPKLRVLNLRENSLSYLPRDVFAKTQLEFLDISFNSFSVVPRESLEDIGMTLRHLSLQSNVLEHVDVTSFRDIPYINHLDMSKNKLTILPDNVFTQLSLLQFLDLSSNPLRANFKELFHYAQNLKYLSLANTGLITTPNFPLPDLIHLNLSYNNLQSINKNSFQNLVKLKHLDLSHCNMNHIPSHLWPFLTNLKELDISNNPIKEITMDSLHGLKSLQTLNIQNMKRITRFEGKAFLQLRILSELLMQTWPIVEKFYEEFCYLLTHLTQLRRLKLSIVEHELLDQLSCLSNKKIVYLEITGRNLQIVHREAFAKISRNPSLTIKISGTQIADLPPGLFAHMHEGIQHLSIDLSHNMLTMLVPETFYGNDSTWDDIGTGLVSGGLLLSGNRFRCGCHLAWLGHWLRRWSRENFNPRTSTLDYINNVQESVKEGTCWDSATERHVPIMKLPPVDMSCQASALSSSADSTGVNLFVAVVLFLVGFGS
ncbi:chaoptin isoform X1 [Euwallacea similis]|uniref:chaoptin isoform X1 n=1 Tax=Euwallacea similis TaxID=1736056 RepID=UPI00344C09A9